MPAINVTYQHARKTFELFFMFPSIISVIYFVSKLKGYQQPTPLVRPDPESVQFFNLATQCGLVILFP